MQDERCLKVDCMLPLLSSNVIGVPWWWPPPMIVAWATLWKASALVASGLSGPCMLPTRAQGGVRQTSVHLHPLGLPRTNTHPAVCTPARASLDARHMRSSRHKGMDPRLGA